MEANKTIDLEVQDTLEVELASTTVDVLDVTIPVPAIVQGGSNIRVQDIPKENGRDAFSTGGAYNLQQQINGKANIEDIPEVPEIPTVPTKLSELENDSKFVTGPLVEESLQGLSDNIMETVVTEFVSKVELEGMNFISEESLDNRGFVTEEQTGAAFEELTTEILTLLTDEFVTKYQLEQEGYLTSDDIEGLATKQYVNGIVGDINQVLDAINGEVI